MELAPAYRKLCSRLSAERLYLQRSHNIPESGVPASPRKLPVTKVGLVVQHLGRGSCPELLFGFSLARNVDSLRVASRNWELRVPAVVAALFVEAVIVWLVDTYQLIIGVASLSCCLLIKIIHEKSQSGIVLMRCGD